VRRHYLVTSLLVLGLAAIACGTEGTSTFETGENDPDAGTGGSSSSSSSGFLPTDPDGGGTVPDCPSKVLCGLAATCCAAGQECVEGACANACASGVRCGATCCGTGQVCLSQTCVAPGKACLDSFDCEENEFCEPTISKCLPQPADLGLCEYKPPVLPLAPVLEWSWTGSAIAHPTYYQVVNTPAVIDVDNDKIPDVVIVTSTGYDDAGAAFVRLLDGKTGLEKWAGNVDAYKDGSGGGADYRVNPRGTPAVADLDGDGTIEIVVPKMGGGLLAFNANGSIKWASRKADNSPYNDSFGSVTVAIADMDNDGLAEIVMGGIVFDHTGKVVYNGSVDWGANDAGYGPVSIIADVDGNPASKQQHVVTGNRAFTKTGIPIWTQAGLTDGYPAIADLDKDGTPELVVIAQGKVRVQNAINGDLIDQLALPGDPTGKGGPPTIADFDNDGIMEIASANGDRYSVFEYDRTKDVGQRISVKWQKTTQDKSSNVTGSSVFDFEGDGIAEVVYNDECWSRVYKGTDGTELFKVANSSATIHEMPVLVDIDGDNNTEFVVVANDANHVNNTVKCLDYPVGTTVRHGVFVYGDSNDRWVRTRKVWNQHAYHITNILADGKVPMIEPRSFEAAQNNDYRVSSQGKGVYNAPDLRVDLEVSTAQCPTAIELKARVKNAGALGVPQGVKVRFYSGTSAGGTLLAEKLTTKALLPGESEVVVHAIPPGMAGSFFVAVEGTTPTGVVNECLTDNNSGAAGGIRCPGVN
jgi:hypothetical protein